MVKILPSKNQIFTSFSVYVIELSFSWSFIPRATSPPSTDTISCVSLFLQLLGHLLSSEVTGRAELTKRGEGGGEGEGGDGQSSPGEDTSSTGSEKKRDSHYEIKNIGFPRPLLKMIVWNEKGVDLLGKLRDALEVRSP